MKIALFVTCVNNTLFPSTGRAVVTVLERLGHQVTFPQPQTCCGQMHLNAGYRPEGLALARSVIDAFSEADVVVAPSASCVGTARHVWANAARDQGDVDLVAAAVAFSSKIYDFTELMTDVLGVTDVGAFYPHRVAYHPTCHSLRSLRLGDRPLRLLRVVRGIQLVDLPHPDACCGFGGLFSVKNPATSTAMGADKLADVDACQAEVLCAADNSCLIHLASLSSGRYREANPATRRKLSTVHIAEILASREETSEAGLIAAS